MTESATNSFKIANQYRKARKIANVLRSVGITAIDVKVFAPTMLAVGVLSQLTYSEASDETWALVQAILEEEQS